MILRCRTCNVVDSGKINGLNVNFWADHLGHELLNTRFDNE